MQVNRQPPIDSTPRVSPRVLSGMETLLPAGAWGVWLIGCVAVAGCGIGTDASLGDGLDAGPANGTDGGVAAADAGAGGDGSSALPEGLPPIDRRSYDATATATFALG